MLIKKYIVYYIQGILKSNKKITQLVMTFRINKEFTGVSLNKTYSKYKFPG